jgi:L,D-peptidoglycan transpeptidase YkuD (ErfK/YbiS/YcfS/YnhG family)
MIEDISGRALVLRSSTTLLTSTKTYTGKMQRGIGNYLRLFSVCIMITSILICSCSHFDEGHQVRSLSREANDFFNQGKYEASLSKYEQIIEKHPAVADRVLFEMGIIHAHPRNEKKDYQSSLECFQKIVKDYPDSEYRRDSQMMIFQIHNVINKDKIIATQQTQIETSWQVVKSRQNEIITLQEKIETLEKQIETREEQIETLEQKIFALQTEPADKVLIEKKERRLTLLSKGEVIKTYKIALGGAPVGPKERQGDSKTPEGTYIIDSRKSNSGYHLSLHISYPNEKDKMRAKDLGVSPGGDIMIHGIKNGLAWVGALHAGIDWTKGCIAVTDEEMEEIYKLVPNGTIVEIRP